MSAEVPASPVTAFQAQTLTPPVNGVASSNPNAPTSSKRLLTRFRSSKRCKIITAVVAVALVAAAVAIIVVFAVLSDDNDDSSTTASSTLTLSKVAVTNVTLVSAKTEDNAKEQCVDLGWIPTGVDWTDSSAATVYYLCMQQSLQESEDAVTVPADEVSVLQRLVVVSDASGCPSNMQTVTNPSSGTFVCAEFATATEAFASDKYVVDLMTTTEEFYNHDTPGWITWPVDVKIESTDSSVFISTRYPVRPIVGLEVLTSVATDSIYSACDELEPVGEWETPGFVLKSSAAATINAVSSDVVVCVQRPPANATDSLVALVDLTVVLPTETCSSVGNSTEITSDQIKLCAEWGTVEFMSDNATVSSTISSPFVAELALYESSASEASDVNISTTIPGNWQVVGDEDTGSLHTFFLARTFEPFVLNATTDSESVSIGDDAVTSSVEATLNQTELSFRVLQIADLHLTGDPDYECSSAPPGPYRASILEAAAAIAREIKNETSTDDPLYNSCREALTIAFMEELLDIEQPDFVVFSGDNVHTSSATNHTRAMGIFTKRVESRRIPWAAVFGNHDTEGGFSREDMLNLMVDGKNYSHVKYGPRTIGGVGNYAVIVVAPADGAWGQRGDTVFRMYFLDSHADINSTTYPLVTNPSSYEWIKETQIDFYRELAMNSVNDSSQNSSVPAVMYFHIPIPEYGLASPSNRVGSKNEETASAEVNSGLFSALVEMGDVKATFVGHDHVNEYCYLRQGIQLCYGGGIGMGRAYGLSDFDRRARVLEWTMDTSQKRTLKSWKRHFADPTQTQSLEVLYSE